MLILGIETSGKTASAALFEDDIMLAQNTLYTAKTHSQIIMPMVKKLMEDSGKELSDLDTIAVSVGPGSYTGLRIGIACVKALAFGLEIPCCGVSSLEGMAYNAAAEGLVCAVMKARQELVYTALFKYENGTLKRESEDMIISVSELNEMLMKTGESILITGDGAEFFKEKYPQSCYRLAPAHIRLQSGAGVCMAAKNHESRTPEEIQASYLQLVKAEKDLIESKSNK